MKIRQGFVSNSSSSSFILAIDKDAEEVMVSIEINLLNHTENEIETIAELKEYFLEEYSYEGDTLEQILKDNISAADNYKKMKKAIESGKKIAIGNVGSDGESEEQFLYETDLSSVKFKNAELIEQEER